MDFLRIGGNGIGIEVLSFKLVYIKFREACLK